MDADTDSIPEQSEVNPLAPARGICSALLLVGIVPLTALVLWAVWYVVKLLGL